VTRPRAPRSARLAAWLCRVVLRLVARVRAEGVDDLAREGPLIVTVNHMSNADPPLVAGWLTPALGRRPHFLAKEALFRGPLGAFLRWQGVVPVRAGGSDVDAYRAARALLDAGEVVVIFPEGTRSRDGALAEPLPGAALLAVRTGAPVLPVGVSGTDRFLRRGARLPRLGARLLLRAGRPYRLEGGSGRDRRDALARASEETMRRIAELLEPRHRGRWAPPSGEEAAGVRAPRVRY
jgi:1-acyl-sn-glycerol-3-phosphate acyltransferase